MVFKVNPVNGKGTLKEESERQLSILSPEQCYDSLVAELEDFVHLLAPLVILGNTTRDGVKIILCIQI